MHSRTIACLLAPLLMAVAACERQPAAVGTGEGAEELAKGVDRSHAGKPIPETELFNADDDPAILSEASGRPLLVNLWASWCAPCVKELPTLEALSRRPGAPRVIAVSEELAERPSVEAFLDKHGISNLESWRDPKMALAGALGVQVMPTTIYYNAAGREVWRFVGDLDWASDEAARLLGEAQPAPLDEAAVDRRQPERDQAQPGEIRRRQRLAEESGTEQDRQSPPFI